VEQPRRTDSTARDKINGLVITDTKVNNKRLNGSSKTDDGIMEGTISNPTAIFALPNQFLHSVITINDLLEA